MIYLDNAATTYLKPDCVERAVAESFHRIGNAGRGAHAPTLNASRLLFSVRSKLAQLFGIDDPMRISFAANATQALNEAIEGLIRPGDHVVTTMCEHNSVLRPLYRKQLQGAELTILQPGEEILNEKGFMPCLAKTIEAGGESGEETVEKTSDDMRMSTSCPATCKGQVSIARLQESLRPDTRAVVIHHASNVTGNVNDLRQIAEAAHAVGALLIVDAAQTAGSLPIDVKMMGIDVLCFTGHKGLFGPQGTGGIYLREGLEPAPLLVGGSGVHSFLREHPREMPTLLEAGTANGHGLAGLDAALDFLLETGVDVIHQKEMELSRCFASMLRDVPGLTLYGDLDATLRAPIVSLNIGDEDSAVVGDVLWEDYGICVRSGIHCAPLMHEYFGTQAQGIVRFSFSYMNEREDAVRAAEAVRELAAGV